MWLQSLGAFPPALLVQVASYMVHVATSMLHATRALTKPLACVARARSVMPRREVRVPPSAASGSTNAGMMARTCCGQLGPYRGIQVEALRAMLSAWTLEAVSIR